MAFISPQDVGRRRAFYGRRSDRLRSGHVIAVSSIAHQFSAVPFPGMSRLQDMTSVMGFTFTNSGGIVLFVVPAFMSTLVLTPPFLNFLQGSDRPSLRHYWFSAASGCVFGFVASAGTCFFLGALAAFLPARDATLWTRLAVLLAGPFFMAMAGGLALWVIFWKEILIGGALFGIFNAWLVRRLAEPGSRRT